MRPRQLWIYITIYVTIITLILFINYTAYQYQTWFGDLTRLFKVIFYQFLILQALVLCVLGTVTSGSAIKEEITGKSYDFFRMLPISAGRKAVGILVGKNLIIILMGGISFLFLIVLGLTGKVKISLLGQYFLVIISVAVLTNSSALLMSIRPYAPRKKTNVVLLVILAFLFAPFLISGIGFAVTQAIMLENIMAKFYTVELPILVLISLIALYFSCWSITGILRRFTQEDEPLFSRIGAFLFMLGFEFILFGLLFEFLFRGTLKIHYLYWFISLLPVLLVPLRSFRNYDRYLEYSGLLQSRSAGNKNIIVRMLLYLNLSHNFILFAIWAICAVGAVIITEQNLLNNLYNIFIIFTFYLFIILLLELYVVYVPVSSKVGLLLSFIVFLHMILPLILSAVFESEIVFMHSLLGFSFRLLSQRIDTNFMPRTFICLFNIALCIIPIILLCTRYGYLLKARRKM
jgi:hypothetical protein